MASASADDTDVGPTPRPTPADDGFGTRTVQMYQPPLASPALQTRVSWKLYFEWSSGSECAQQWWGDLTRDWPELRDYAYLPFCGAGREEIVDDCLGKLQQLHAGTLKFRQNSCVLGARGIGKTCLLKALVCLNSVLSGTTLSIFLDGRVLVARLSELIVRGLDTRYPNVMAHVRPVVEDKLGAGWEREMSYVVKVLQVIKRRVFVVLDAVDCVFARPGQEHVLSELLQLGEDSQDVLVYLAAAGTRTRVLVTGRLPAAERADFASYTGVSLNCTKYRFVVQRALQYSRRGFQDAVRQVHAGGGGGGGGGGEVDGACPEKLYVRSGGRISTLAQRSKVHLDLDIDLDVDIDLDLDIDLAQAAAPGTMWWHGLNAFWAALTASTSTLAQSFRADPFQQYSGKALAVEFAALLPHLPAGSMDEDAARKLFYELSDQCVVYFDDAARAATVSLVHPCDMPAFVLAFGEGEVRQHTEALASPGGQGAAECSEESAESSRGAASAPFMFRGSLHSHVRRTP